MLRVSETVHRSRGNRAGDRPGDMADLFARHGFVVVGQLLSPAQRSLLLNHLAFGRRIDPTVWEKGRATQDRLLYDLATRPVLLNLLRQILGEDIVLWGASTVERKPGQRHAWHVDIESSAPDQRFATVWIGFSNTCRDSGLSLVTGSHRLGKTVQEVQRASGRPRGTAADEEVLAWARAQDPACALAQPDVGDGDAIVFDGRVWHGSLNLSGGAARKALLLQYAGVDSPVRLPKRASLEWPFEFESDRRPPVIVVSGSGNGGGNLQVEPPPTSPATAQMIATEASRLDLPLQGDPDRGWTPHPLFSGLTEVHDYLTCHASVLGSGRKPHPPHSHIEEEILVVLDGEAELLVGDGPASPDVTPHPVRAGMFAYYPAYWHHTLRNTGRGPLTYLMFKWHGAPLGNGEILGAAVIDPSTARAGAAAPYKATRLLDGPTNFLGKLHVHCSVVQPGGGYDPHADPYDVAIVMLEGAAETVGRRIEPFGVVYYRAGQAHGLRAVGPVPARYLVFEFHGDGAAREKRLGAIAEEASTLYRRIERFSRRYPGLRRAVPGGLRKIARRVLG